MSNTFKALVARMESNEFKVSVQNRSIEDLPEGNTIIEVKYSSLNYKDGMAISGNKERYYVIYQCLQGLMLQEL